jgi:hypothetical protein
MAIDVDMYKIRIEGAQEAVKRSRLVFLVLTVASLTVITALWNAYFSSARATVIERATFVTNEVTRAAQQLQTEEWVKSRTINISLLGINLGVSDAAPLGSSSLFILTIWFFLTTRRENHAIGQLLRESKNAAEDLRRMIFYGISSYLVFLTLGSGDEPIRALDGPDLPAKQLISIRALVKALFFIAPFAMFMIVTADILSICTLNSVFRVPHVPLINVPDIPRHMWKWMVGWDIYAFMLAHWASFLCWRALQFEEGTGEILKQYAEGFKSAHSGAKAVSLP